MNVRELSKGNGISAGSCYDILTEKLKMHHHKSTSLLALELSEFSKGGGETNLIFRPYVRALESESRAQN